MKTNILKEFTKNLQLLSIKKILLLWDFQSGELSGNSEFNLLLEKKSIKILPKEAFSFINNHAKELSRDFYPQLQKLIMGEKESIKGFLPIPDVLHANTLLSYSFYKAGSSMIHGFFEFKSDENNKDKENEYFEIKADLWKTKKRFFTLLKALPGQMFRFSNQGILMDFYLNENGIISETTSQCIGKSIIDIFPDNIAYKTLKKIKEVSETNKVTFFECQTENNTYINHYEIHMAPNENKEVVCIFNDITSRKQAQRSLNLRDQILSILAIFSNKYIDEQHFEPAIQDSFQKLGETLRLNSIFMILYDKFENEGRRIIEWNNNEKELSGCIHEFEKLIPIPEMHKRHMDGRVWIAREATAPSFKVEEFLCKYYLCSIVTVPIFKLGKYYGTLCLLKKAPDHYWANAELDAFKLFTNTIGTSISRNQYVCELRSAREKAEESERMKSSFLANMSHEIRTPLNSIMGFSELIGIEDISEGERKLFSSLVQKNSQQLLFLINDILDLAKIESGKSSISKTSVNVNQIIKEIHLCLLAQKPKVRLIPHCELPDNEAVLDTDSIRLTQVINNLLSNALKFTSQGYIKFGYTLDNNHLCFFVEDTGIGIPEIMLNKIFIQFQQAEECTTRKYGGTGLGLSICKNLVELMGGEIWVESTPEVGSTFYFKLPYEKIPATA